MNTYDNCTKLKNLVFKFWITKQLVVSLKFSNPIFGIYEVINNDTRCDTCIVRGKSI